MCESTALLLKKPLLVGDKPVARPRHIRQKAVKPITETLTEKDFAPAATY